MPLPHEVYIGQNQIVNETILLTGTLPTNLYQMIWAAFNDKEFTFPSEDAVPDGEPVPTTADDIAAVKDWASKQFAEAIVRNAIQIKAELEQQRAKANAEQAINDTYNQVKNLVQVSQTVV